MSETDASPAKKEVKDSNTPLTEEEVESIRDEAIEHISSATYKKVLARLNRSPEYHDKSDDKKKELAYGAVKTSLNSSYGETLRTELIKLPDLKDQLLDDSSNIIVTGDEDSSDSELEDEEA